MSRSKGAAREKLEILERTTYCVKCLYTSNHCAPRVRGILAQSPEAFLAFAMGMDSALYYDVSSLSRLGVKAGLCEDYHTRHAGAGVLWESRDRISRMNIVVAQISGSMQSAYCTSSLGTLIGCALGGFDQPWNDRPCPPSRVFA